MHPADKAIKILTRFLLAKDKDGRYLTPDTATAKTYALIAVDEVIENSDTRNSHVGRNYYTDYEYFLLVKEELEKL